MMPLFRYFGGMPQECVYDQTKLVVIHEIFRELELNHASINTPPRRLLYPRL